MPVKLVSKHFDNPEAYKLSEYEKLGGYKSLETVFKMQPDEVIELVKN